MKKVTIVQHRLLHYRVELFEMLKHKLQQHNIELELVYGDASATTAIRQDQGSLAWATKIRNKYFNIAGTEILWQTLPNKSTNCDLLILMQENKILSNYHHILVRKIKHKKTAFWGHGKNLQSLQPHGIKERWKKSWLKNVDWWYAYTHSTVTYLTQQGYPHKQITRLDNAIDNQQFKQDLNSINLSDIVNEKQSLGISYNASIGLYCGSLYTEKRLGLMIEIADKVKSESPEFYLIVIGDGPEANVINEAAKTRSWIKFVGVKRGVEKALLYKMSSFILSPGLVGLHILDSFCAGKPTVTSSNALHSPEIDYLEHGFNGLVLNDNPQNFAKEVIKLLSDQTYYTKMQENAFAASEKYTLIKMVENFSGGIVNCLNSSRENI